MNNENTWNLKTLYPSPTSDALHNDFVAFEKAIDALNSFSKSELKSYDNAKYKLENYINLLSNVCEYYKIGNYLSLQISANGKDYESIKLLDKFEEMTTSLTKPFTSFVKFIKEIDNLDEYISESYYLDDFSFLLHDIKLNSKYTLSEQEEIIIDKLKISGASSFEKLRDNTISSLRIHVDFDDKKQMLSFSEVRNLAYSHDPNIRKKSYEAELSSYKNIDDTVAVCLNSIKGWAITESNIRGYSSILDKTLIGSKMKKETFDAMMTSIQQSLPKLQQYFAHKAKLLGHDNGLPFYDLFASLGNETYTFSYNDAKNIIIKTFKEFNSEIGNFIENAFNNDWIDAFPRSNKRDGAFCSNIHQIKESRILSNFTGSFSDMSTLAHELGHAFHGECLKDEHFLNSDYPMPIAETASIFFETILMDSFMKVATKDQKITLLDNSISDQLQVLVDIYSRFIFENNFISERKTSTLSTEEICNMMKNAQILAYGDGLDKTKLHEYMWIAKPHYYSADFNYYNFPYAFGLLFSRGIYDNYVNSKNKNDFFISYKNLLKETGKNNIEDIAKIMNIDITEKTFWKKSILTVIDEIDEFIELTK